MFPQRGSRGSLYRDDFREAVLSGGQSEPRVFKCAYISSAKPEFTVILFFLYFFDQITVVWLFPE